MDLVKSFAEIKDNMNTLDGYIANESAPECSYALDKIKRGTCFIAQKCGDAYKFYPSRFVGYVNNSMTLHEKNDSKDGRETNDAISKILERKPLANDVLEKFYKNYCERLGFTANNAGSFGVTRKFWEVL
ncbi:MAG: hypothetical protein IKP64_03130 [Selenomonadaceae bacterium]|nr:hypothetical protein [Selenomonadaceae bacterium]MBR4382530.1 hypothetical protein [Selenomonadaceae bacterium]